MAVAVFVRAAGGLGSKVLELVVADRNDFFIRQDAFEDFDEISGADASDDLAFFKLALVIFDKDKKFSERSEDGAAGYSDDGLGFPERDAEVSAIIRAKAVRGIRDGGVEVETRILGGVAGVEALEDPGEFLAGKNIKREGGSRADLDCVEFGGLKNQALREELDVIANLDKRGFRRERKTGHGVLKDHMA